MIQLNTDKDIRYTIAVRLVMEHVDEYMKSSASEYSLNALNPMR